MLHKKTKLGKRIQSLLLCLCMVLSCLPVSVFATGETETACTETDCNGHYENGFCTADGTHYHAATLNDNGTDDTSDDYYEIGNAGQLYWFAAKVNGGEWDLNGKLTADITVNGNGDLVESFYFYNGYIETEPTVQPRTWTPIGGDNYNWEYTVTGGVGYAGTFDGNGKTISGLYYDSRKVTIPEDDKWRMSYYAVGLFSFLNGATLKNITVTDSIFYSACHIKYKGNNRRHLFLGGIAGVVVAESRATTIEGCTVKSSELTAHRSSDSENGETGCYDVYLGGILGSGLHGDKSLTIRNCEADGVALHAYAEQRDLMVGGIMGWMISAGLKPTMENCRTYGVKFDYVKSGGGESQGVGIGGIIGHVDATTNGVTIKGCTASGNTFTNVGIVDSTDGVSGIGGIVGYAFTSDTNLTIESCTNASDVKAEGRKSGPLENIGGIVGHAESQKVDAATFTIKNCANTGDVSTPEDGNVSSTANVGGIVGRVDSNGADVITIEGCYNTGAVSALAVSFYESENVVAAAGGLIGSAVGGAGEDSVGTVKNCYNTGAVTANCGGEGETTSYAGAVIGRRESTVAGTFSGLYYKTGTAAAASGDGSEVNGATGKSADEFASGEVCYLLNGSKSEGTLVWYQTLIEGGDPSPVLDSSHGIVSYDADKNEYVSTGTLTATVSVTITWTSMAFTYTDGAWDPAAHDYDIGKWSTSGGTIQVENTGNVTVTASFVYVSETGGNGISGSFTKQSFDLDESTSDTTKLTLSGKPSKSLNNDRIGTITVMIAQKNE